MGLLVAYAAGGWAPATAAEALTLPGAIGSGDFRQALLPAPGLYGALSMFGANVDKYHLSPSTETQMSGSQFAGLAAQHELIKRSLFIADFSCISVEANVGNVMLSAGVGATADLDLQFENLGISLSRQLPG